MTPFSVFRFRFLPTGFLVAVADHVEAHEVGGAGFGAGSGDDADDLTGVDVALGFEDVFGHVD